MSDIRKQLAGWRWRAEQATAFQQHWGDGLPARSRLQLWRAHWLHLAGRPGTWPLILPGYRYPVYFRTGTSDLAVIRENLVEQQYAGVGSLPEVRTILDCGGNIGTASFYFLHRYPDARLLLVEPDPGNLAIARKTLRPFGDRVQLLQGGVWSHTGPLKLSRSGFRDGAEWSIQVRPARAEESPDLQAYSVPDLLAMAGFKQLDLLKVDIEAAEAELFRQPDDWLPLVRNLAIEIHGEACDWVVSAAVASQGFERLESGELTLFLRENWKNRTPQTASGPI